MASLKIFALDDNGADLYLLAQAFARHSEVQLQSFQDKDEALTWLLAQPAQYLPDLISLELHLPGQDGLTWLARLRQFPILQDLPVLLYSQTLIDRELQEIDPAQVCGMWQKNESFANAQAQADTLVSLWRREQGFDCDRLRQLPGGLAAPEKITQA